MVAISMLRVDPRGRIQIPRAFLRANGINPSDKNKDCIAIMKPSQGDQVEVRLEFIQSSNNSFSVRHEKA